MSESKPAPRLPPVVRDAIAADIAAIVALVTSAYRGDASRAGWTTEADLLDGQRIDDEAVRALLTETNPASTVLLASQDGVLLACCHIAREDDGEGYFGMFAVRPDRQGQGLGDRLLAEAERMLATRFRCRHCRMTVVKQRTELIPYYQRRGYALTGKEKPFPYGDERFGRPRRRDLVFVVLEKDLTE